MGRKSRVTEVVKGIPQMPNKYFSRIPFDASLTLIINPLAQKNAILRKSGH
jgi:hypothetical protein